ncbi:hypothetical protein GCM10009599_13840 [Luteococcus peritonei]
MHRYYVQDELPSQNLLDRRRPPTQLAVLVTSLSRPLQPLLVTDDITFPVGQHTPVARVDVEVPEDRDGYDSRAWRVHAGSTDYARTVLDPQVWHLLEEHSRRWPVRLFVDADRLVALDDRHRNQTARLLGQVADLLEQKMAAGLLARWYDQPVAPPGPAQPLRLGSRHDTRTWPGWEHPVDHDQPDLLELATDDPELADVRPRRALDPPGRLLRGRIDGQVFALVREDAHHARLLVPLVRPIPDEVTIRARRLFPGGIGTEWEDFNDRYVVKATFSRVGHATSSPLLMQLLQDDPIDALHVRGRWAWLDVEGDTIEALRGPLAVLARAREVLPDFEISPPQRRGYYALDD